MVYAKVYEWTVLLVHKLGLGKEVVSLSLVVMEVSRGGGMRWWRREVGLQIYWKKDLDTLTQVFRDDVKLAELSNNSFAWTILTFYGEGPKQTLAPPTYSQGVKQPHPRIYAPVNTAELERIWPGWALRVATDDLSTTEWRHRPLRLARHRANATTTSRITTPANTLSHTASVTITDILYYILYSIGWKI